MARRMIRGWRAAGVLAALILAAGCARGETPGSVLDERLAGGGRIADLLAPDRPTALLIYPPGYTFACAAELARWRELERAGGVKAVLVLDREPSASDRKALAIRRVQVAGIIARRPDDLPPREFLVESGAIRISAQGTEQTGARSPVLAHILASPGKHASR